MAFHWPQRFVFLPNEHKRNLHLWQLNMRDILCALNIRSRIFDHESICVRNTVFLTACIISQQQDFFQENLLCKITAHSDGQMVPIWEWWGLGESNVWIEHSALPTSYSLFFFFPSGQKIFLLEEPKGFFMCRSQCCFLYQDTTERSEFSLESVTGG